MIAPTDHIKLQLGIGNHKVETVDLVSNRTFLAARTLEGKSIDDALTLLPLLFSLCGSAQYHCALMAIEQALGITPSAAQKNVRAILVDAEGIGEHITRIMMDWATHAYVDTKILKIRESRKKISEFKSLLYEDEGLIKPGGSPIKKQSDQLHRHCIHLIDVCEQDIFGCPLDHFYSLRTEEDLKAWLHGNVAVAAACMKVWTHHGYFEHEWPQISLLPDLPKVFLESRLDGSECERFIAQPQYDKPGYETGCLEKHMAHPLLQSMGNSAKTRLIAKLLDLAKSLIDLSLKIEQQIPDEPFINQEAPLKGLGHISAVRGHLFHRVWLKEDAQTIDRYRILAPTEWNFHPEGPLKKAIFGTKFYDNRRLMEQTRLFVLALDPCVACDLEILDMDQLNHA